MARIFIISQSRGSSLASSEAFNSSTLLSMNAWASALACVMRSAREALGASGCGCDLALNLLIIGEFSGKAIINLPGLINPVADVGFFPGVAVLSPDFGIFVLAGIGADAFLFLSH